MPGDISVRLRIGLGRKVDPQVISELLPEGQTGVGAKNVQTQGVRGYRAQPKWQGWRLG